MKRKNGNESNELVTIKGFIPDGPVIRYAP